MNSKLRNLKAVLNNKRDIELLFTVFPTFEDEKLNRLYFKT